MLNENYNGKVPDSIEKLIKLPGVARKTANVVLGSAFHKKEGIVVDTHVIRLSQKLGLTDQKKPEKIELLPFHSMALEKWESLGASCPYTKEHIPSPETIARLQSCLNSALFEKIP